jgi:(2R)-ethylmalonyl-CoA mutase
MRTLFDGIPLDAMNTSMTINATAPWLLALYVAVADEQGADRARLAGTTQNDIIKEYLSRGTYVFPPEPSLRLTTDMIGWTYLHTRNGTR